MTPIMKRLAAASAAVLLMLALPVAAQEFSATQRSEIERIIKDYLVSHPEVLQEAIASLRKALSSDPEIADAYDHLAIAYGRKGDFADADLASAQAAFNRGNLPTARQLAARAKGRFAIGSPGWVKADDIASFKPPQPRRLIP